MAEIQIFTQAAGDQTEWLYQVEFRENHYQVNVIELIDGLGELGYTSETFFKFVEAMDYIREEMVAGSEVIQQIIVNADAQYKRGLALLDDDQLQTELHNLHDAIIRTPVDDRLERARLAERREMVRAVICQRDLSSDIPF